MKIKPDYISKKTPEEQLEGLKSLIKLTPPTTKEEWEKEFEKLWETGGLGFYHKVVDFIRSLLASKEENANATRLNQSHLQEGVQMDEPTPPKEEEGVKGGK